MSLTETIDGHVLVHCHAGCSVDAVLAAAGLTRRDLYPIRKNDRRQDPVVSTYRYVDEHGTLLFEVERTITKKFRQRRPNPDDPGQWIYNLTGVQRVLYRLPRVVDAVKNHQPVYLVEGEKDVHAAEKLGHTATCNPGGAGKWRPEYTPYLAGAEVIIIADNDPPGLEHARQVAAALRASASSITIGVPTIGKDLSDLVAAGLGVDDINLLGNIVEPDSTPAAAPTLPDIREDPREPDDSQDRPVADTTGWRHRLTAASAFERKGAVWLWETPDTHSGWLVAGAIGLVAGREGVGKSTFLAWLAAQITRGRLPGIHHGTPKAVLYAANEDSWSYTIAPRLLAAGADLDRVYRVDMETPEGSVTGLTLPRDGQRLPEMAREVDAAVLLCDPILSLVDAKINPNHSQELRAALEPLGAHAEAAGIAVVGLVHFNKAKDVDVNSMIAGSRAWTEVPRTIISIAFDTELEHCVVTQTKNNRGARQQANLTYRLVDTVVETTDGSGRDIHIGRVVWGDDSDVDAQAILQRRPGEGGSGVVAGTQASTIIDYLRDAAGAQSPRQIADATTMSRESVKTILSRMLMRGQVRRVGTGLYTVDPDMPGSEA